jgi:dipeptidyl aminopeptidase/acylaminoacyl peptidase
MVNLARIALLGAAAAALPQFAHAADACPDVLPAGDVAGPVRALVPEDLVRLRDIGPVEPGPQASGLFAVSPDGRRAAFQVRRADPAGNAYCLAMVVVELRAGRRILVVDRGGEAIRQSYTARGKANFPTGVAKAITPRWSPDGTWLAYLRRDKGSVQLWRANADGSGSMAITQSPDDIEDFRIAPDGRSIVYSALTGLKPGLAALEQEGRSGFHYDDRFGPTSSTLPYLRPPIPRTTFFLDLASGATRPAAGEEAAMLKAGSMAEGDWTSTSSPHGTALIEVPPGTIGAPSSRLSVVIDGRTLACAAEACTGASHPWWTSDGKLRFRRREGWAKRSTAIYEWQPGRRHAWRLHATDDLLLSCVPDGDALICLREGSLQPRRLERIDPASGRSRVLFDPNPEFARRTLGRVERLQQRNSFGLESFADLVLPVGYQPGMRYPMVVVQYSSRGFLRGGTGDDYPIQAFANRGFAVLSINKPISVGALHTTDFLEGDRINLKDFADRRSTLESLEAAVKAAIDRGVADPARIGITGMSDGASTAGFALLHSRLFSAYAMSQCCWDTTQAMRVGPAAAREFQFMGYPKLTDDSPAASDFWSKIAISPNARKIRAPILLQLSQHELLTALQSHTALKEVGAPVDLFVFPGEYHAKWQPAHRLALYERSIDWFDYWLNGVRDLGAERENELRHWDALRKGQPVADAPDPPDATPRP